MKTESRLIIRCLLLICTILLGIYSEHNPLRSVETDLELDDIKSDFRAAD